MTKRTLAGWLAAAAWLTSATPARADGMWDFFAWMEEFSGPGPFGGIEVSFEVGCFELGRQFTASKDDVMAYRETIMRAFDTPAERSGAALTPQKRAALNALEATRARQAIAAGTLPTSVDDIVGQKFTNLPKRRVNEGRLRNCWAAEGAFDRQAAEKDATAERQLWHLLNGGTQVNEVPVRVRGPQTGVVLGVGYYRPRGAAKSTANTATSDGGAPGTLRQSPNWPLVEVFVFDGLLHHKLTPAVDIGGGVGLTFFKANGDTDPAFHLIPVSTVLKPLAFVSTKRYASAFGLRLGARLYPQDLDGADFGLDPAIYLRPGELLWNVSLYVDIASLLAPKAK